MYDWKSWDDAYFTPEVKCDACEPDPPKPPVNVPLLSTATTVVVRWEETWNNGKMVSKYDLEIKSSRAPWAPVGTVVAVQSDDDGALPELCARDLSPGMDYFFRARSYNELGWSPWSADSLPIATNAIPPPSQPFLHENGTNWIDLAWRPPIKGLVSHYELQMRAHRQPSGMAGAAVPEEPPAVLVDPKIPECGFLVPGLRPLRKYRFRIRAFTTVGWSAYTEWTEPIGTGRRF